MLNSSRIKPSLCVGICTYSRYNLLPFAVDSVLRQDTSGLEVSVVIVDNSPDALLAKDNSKRYENSPNVTYLYEPIPGVSNARNVAANATQADIICYLDDDAVAHPGWLISIAKAFQSFDNVGIVGGPIAPIWDAPRPEWLHESLLGYLSAVDWGGELRLASNEEWFAGANIAFRRIAVLDNGGFDVSLGRIGSGASLLSNEETKLVKTLKSSGYSAVYAADARVDHLIEGHRLTQTWFKRRVIWQSVSDYIATGGAVESHLSQKWQHVLRYLSSLTPDKRSFRGLFSECSSADQFTAQLAALYDFNYVSLAGFSGVE